MRNRNSSLTQNLKVLLLRRNLKGKNRSSESAFSANKKMKRGLERRSKSKFHEYLKMEMTKGVISAEEDLEMERSLAKKLKLKEKKLGGLNDGLNLLIKGITSEFGSEFNDFSVAEHDYDQDGSKVKIGKRKHDDEAEESEKEIKRVAKSKKHKRTKSFKAFVKHLEEQCPVNKTIDYTEYHVVSNVEESPNEKPKPDASVKYVAPHLRASSKSESEDHAHIRHRLRGFLNKLSESNVESVAGEVAAIFQLLAVLVVK